jgi:hypothetical protein
LRAAVQLANDPPPPPDGFSTVVVRFGTGGFVVGGFAAKGCGAVVVRGAAGFVVVATRGAAIVVVRRGGRGTSTSAPAASATISSFVGTVLVGVALVVAVALAVLVADAVFEVDHVAATGVGGRSLPHPARASTAVSTGSIGASLDGDRTPARSGRAGCALRPDRVHDRRAAVITRHRHPSPRSGPVRGVAAVPADLEAFGCVGHGWRSDDADGGVSCLLRLIDRSMCSSPAADTWAT